MNVRDAKGGGLAAKSFEKELCSDNMLTKTRSYVNGRCFSELGEGNEGIGITVKAISQTLLKAVVDNYEFEWRLKAFDELYAKFSAMVAMYNYQQ